MSGYFFYSIDAVLKAVPVIHVHICPKFECLCVLSNGRQKNDGALYNDVEMQIFKYKKMEGIHSLISHEN